MKLTKNEWLRAGGQVRPWLTMVVLVVTELLGMAAMSNAQAVSTTTVQGTVYQANGRPGAGTIGVSWPAFTTGNNQAVTAGRTTVAIAPDGFMSVNLAPNLGATPAGLYYTAVYHLSDGTTSTEYWVVPAAAQASIGQVRAQLMPAAQAVQAVSKAYVDQSIAALTESLLTVDGGTMTGPLYLNGDPSQSLQAADKHYVDSAFAKALPLSGGNMTGPLTSPGVNGVQSPVTGSSQTTLQAAMSAAGTNGAVEIPPGYAGTDGFTNPNGVYVTDLRQSGSQQFARSVKEFGAVCDGATDDTNALQAAINYAQTHGVALTIPQGTCKTQTLIWHGESIGGLGKQVSALMGFPGQDVLATATDSVNLLAYTRIHDLTIDVDQSVDVSCSAAMGRTPAGSCTTSRPLENSSIFSPGGNGLNGTIGTGKGWAVGNCAIAMPAVTGAGGNGLRVAEIENLEIVATGVDPMANYPGAHSTHTCGMYLAQWPQWSEFRNIDIRGLNTGIAIPALPGTTPAGLNADSNRWQNVTIQATHGFTAGAGSNNVLDNVVMLAGNSAATAEAPTGLVLDLTGTQQGWTIRNAAVLPAWNAVQPQLAVMASGGAVTAVTAGPERGLGFDPYGTQVPLAFSGSCTAQGTASVNSDGSIGSISVTQGGAGCGGTTSGSVNVAGTWDTASPVNLIGGQNMTFFAGNLLKGNGGYTVWNATSSQSYGTQLAGGGGILPGGGSYSALVGSSQPGSAYQVEAFPGVDFGAKLQACLGALSATYGGSCDARNFSGTLSMGSNLTISRANTTVLLPCATISTSNQLIVTAGTRNVTLRGCALRGASNASGSQGGTVFLYSGTGAMVQVGDPTYAADTPGFHLDNVVINTTAASSAAAKAIVAYRTQELDLESLYLLGNSNQTGMTLDGTGNYAGGTFFDNAFNGFQIAVNAIGHQIPNPAATDWLNASTFVRLHIDCPTTGGSPIAGTIGINLAQGDGNTFTGGDVEGCNTALHLGANAQNNTIVGLRNENSNSQVVADAGSAYNNWMTGGTMFTGQLTDNGTRNSFLDTFHRSFNGLNGDWYGSQKDATITNHYRLGTGTGNERGLLNRYQSDYGYRWTMGLSDATAGEQFYQVQDELNNVYRLSIGQYNNGQSSSNNQTVINAAGTGAVVLNGSNNSGTGGVVFGSGGASESTVATISNTGSGQFNGTLQVGGVSTFTGTPTVKNQADAEIDAILWAGLTASQKESLIYKDWNGNSQWYMVKDASNNWALNSAIGGLDSIKAYQSTNSGDTYINASNAAGVVRVNYETGAGSGFNIYGGGSSSLYASFTGATAIKFPGLAASSGHNCLQIDNSGYISNTGSGCSAGGGGGTVNAGTTGQIAYYTSNGSALGGTSAVPITSGGTGAATATGAISNLLPGVTSDAANGIHSTGSVAADISVAAPSVTASQVLNTNVVNPPTTTTIPGHSIIASKSDYLNLTAYLHPGAGWGGGYNYLSFQQMVSSTPGVNMGNPAVGQGGWSSAFGQDTHITHLGAGQAYGLRLQQTQAAPGDNLAAYFYNYCYNGATGTSDQGCALVDMTGGEAGTTFQGSVSSMASATLPAFPTQLTVAATQDAGLQGDGRYLIDKANSTGTSKAVATGYVTAITQPSGQTPGSFTIGSTITPSTAWGSLASNVATPFGANAGITFTPMTFNVNILGGTGTFNTSELWCFIGEFVEQTRATSVAIAGSVATVTVPLRQPHESGSWVMQGGPCGTFIDFTANQATASTLLRYPVPILGATSANTLEFASAMLGNGYQGFYLGNLTIAQYGAKNLSNTGGVLKFQNTGVIYPFQANIPIITFSGFTGADAIFNGPCYNTAYSTTLGYLTCTQTASIGASNSTTNGFFAVGDTPYGNGDFTLWSGAEVIDVQNEAQTPPTVDGTLTLEPNNMPLAVGDVVEEPHHYASKNFLSYDALSSYIPSTGAWGTGGFYVGFNGAGIVGSSNVLLTSAAPGAIEFNNNNPSGMYQYWGGVPAPIGGLQLGGSSPWQWGLAMHSAPQVGGYGLWMGKPLSATVNGVSLGGVTDPNYYYYVFGSYGTNANLFDQLKFTPYTDSYSWTFGNCTLTMNSGTTNALAAGLTPGISSSAACPFIVPAGSLTGTVLPAQIGTGTPAAGKYVDGGTGAWTALPGAVTVPASASLLGSTSGSALQAITLGANLSLAGTILNASASGANYGVPFWLQNLGTGADGALSVTTTTSLYGEKFYTSVNVAFGGVLTVPTSGCCGPLALVIHATGTCTIAGTINARGVDNAGSNPIGGGGSGGSGGGTAAGTAGTSTYLAAGNTVLNGPGGTAGAASGGNGGNGSAPNALTSKALLNSGGGVDGLDFGGGSGKAGGSSGGAAGIGGNSVILDCAAITGTDGAHTGTIDVSGGPGGNATGNSTGAGSGGGGGIVILSSRAAIATPPAIYIGGGAGGLVSVPEAVTTGQCTTPAKATLAVSGGALTGACTVVQAGTGCAPTAPLAVLGGGGTLGTVTGTFSGGSLTSCTLGAGGSGYTAATYTTAGTGGDGGPGLTGTYTGW